MALSFPIPSDSTGLSPSERRTLRMIADLLEAMSRPTTMISIPPTPRPRFVFGNVELDTGRRSVCVDGEEVDLAPREYELLVALATANGAVVTLDELRLLVWHGSIHPDSRAIAQCVSALRRKIEPDRKRPEYIQLVRKCGYRLNGTWVE